MSDNVRLGRGEEGEGRGGEESDAHLDGARGGFERWTATGGGGVLVA
jgi:hypothetical protein